VKRVCKYVVVSFSNITELQYIVNTYLLDGWELQGGIATNVTSHGKMFYQALTKVEDNDGIN
jgi:hypothetical protein